MKLHSTLVALFFGVTLCHLNQANSRLDLFKKKRTVQPIINSCKKQKIDHVNRLAQEAAQAVRQYTNPQKTPKNLWGLLAHSKSTVIEIIKNLQTAVDEFEGQINQCNENKK